jgi:hypothetical protein
VLDAPDKVSALEVGLRVELEDKRTLWGQEGFLPGRGFMELTWLLYHTHNVFFLLMIPAAYQQPCKNTSHQGYNLGLSWGKFGYNLSLLEEWLFDCAADAATLRANGIALL